MIEDLHVTRRQFMQSTSGLMLAAGSGTAGVSAATAPAADSPVCVFTKPLQWLSYAQLADQVAEFGFDGIEGTVRPKGHVVPERVQQDLPRLVQALRARDLDFTIMTTAVNSIRDPLSRSVLKTAADLGIRRYRMGYYRYDKASPIIDQLHAFREQCRELADFNREHGLSAIYQNHSGDRYVGAPIWDLHWLLDGIDAQQVGVAFDIRHATVEGGLSWPIQFRLIRPQMTTVYVKDFVWQTERPKNVPLGQGRV
ncbi:MAG: TIM barrel protein, partial [Planctomycetaceae bacterium]